MPDPEVLEDLTPVTRPEAILNGSEITPVTRWEYFMAQAANEVPKPEGSSDAGKVVTVNSDGDGFSLEEPAGGLPDTTGHVGDVLTAASDGVEWVTPNFLPMPANADRGKVLGVKSNQNAYEFKTMPKGTTVLNFDYSGTTVSNFPDQAAFNVYQSIINGDDFIFMLSENGTTHYLTSRNVELKEVVNVKTVHIIFFKGMVNSAMTGYELLWSTDESTWESTGTLTAF